MIKNIVFDVGDVLLSYRWRQQLMDYGLSEELAEKVGNLMFDDELWHELDLNNMSQAEIIRQYKEKYPEYAKVMEWFITHGEFMHVKREEVWKRLHDLKEKGYGIYILSNYSEDLFTKHTKDASFIDDADGMVVSYQIHITKPDAGIYEELFHRYSLKAEECIFFDDRAENTAAARNLGMQAVTITSQEQLLGEMLKLLEK